VDLWAQFSSQAWAVRVLLLASAVVVITGVGGWVVSLLLLVFMAVVARLAWPHIRRR
jgi:hypothetical protein